MKWALLVLLVFTSTAGADSLSETSDRFALEEIGIELKGTEKFYTIQDIANSAKLLKTEETSPSDYIFKAGLYVADVATITFLSGRSRIAYSKKAIWNGLTKKANLGKRGGAIIKYILGRMVLNSPLERYKDYIEEHEEILHFIEGLFLERPTPGGLKAASRTAIYYAAEDYAYAINHGVSQEHPDMRLAEDEISEAVRKYKSYTGYLDAASLTYTNYSPEGFDFIIENCIKATDHVQRALKTPEKKPKESDMIVVY